MSSFGTGQRRRVLLAAAASSWLLAGASRAQEGFPSQPLKLVVPFPPGGVADLAARPLAQSLERGWNQRVLVENRPGGGGSVGMASVARARPDGLTALMALSSITVIPEAERLNGRKPSYELRDLSPVALITGDPTVLVVPADALWRNAREFLADAQRRPGMISYGSSGYYGTLHVAMEILAAAAEVRLLHVPFTGAGPAVTALLGGHIQALASGPSAVIGQIRAGKLRALASWGRTRLAALPEVPTFQEQGIDAEFTIWSGVFLPGAVASETLATWREAVRRAVRDPQFLQALAAVETPLQYLDAPDFTRFLERDAQRMAGVVQRIGRER